MVRCSIACEHFPGEAAGDPNTNARGVRRWRSFPDAGLAFDTDPCRVAKSGSAQDAAQLAAIEIAATGAAAPQRPDAPLQS
ncbi:hypothetical protein GCM10011504_53880 [Siccirubricoccus deserti]|uniref:Uncharacterized protein n=1 Tax=Siccirubricoccus deserti TaxID=2013562 RepID=A0A9X0R2W6_9PROT|nr:hypothetical protein [Siccirubricoccus deserti]MBC4018846.1 hypothetical protein [Siccirubricoccus deserti]GGC69188.1 hypothetical protein GCM10011504_53880 [Siccirubricoccus deserti]